MPFSSKRSIFDELYTCYESIERIYKGGFINTDTLKDKIIYYSTVELSDISLITLSRGVPLNRVSTVFEILSPLAIE